METFSQYLQQKGYNQTSIYTMTQTLKRFKSYLTTQKLKPHQCTYNDATGYIQYLAQKGLSQRSIQHNIGILKNYYTHLQQTNKTIQYNPIQHLAIKGIQREQIHDILPLDTLEYLLENYPNQQNQINPQPLTPSQHRNKIILSLLIHQGITTTELKALTIDHIELRKGNIHIPETPRSNPRNIPLHPAQLLDLNEYIHQHREELLQQSNQQTDKLIVATQGGKNAITNTLNTLQHQAKKILPTLKNLKQLRQAAIQRWLNQYGLRKTQYLAGHRYVSSTERYQKNDIHELQNQLEKYGLNIND